MRIRGLLACLFFAVAGCHIEHNEGGSDSDGVSICSSFCDRLLVCGSIDGDQIASCTSRCVDSYRIEEEKRRDKDDFDDDDDKEERNATRDGCSCVLQDVCRPVDAYQCPGAPMPPAGQGGSSSQGGAGGASQAGAGGTSPAGAGGTSQGGTGGSSQAGAGGGAGGGGFVCTVNHDCATGEDCVEGLCKLRCKASCQCHAGEVCVEGYCGVPAEPVVSCASDCDCTAGQSCVNGACK